MAILGVLLGITMTLSGLAIWYGRKELAKLTVDSASMQERVTFLEKRKALLAEAVTSAPKPTGVPTAKLRTWNEDAAAVEAKK